MREPNILLDALIDEAGMSHDGLAVAREPGSASGTASRSCTTMPRSAGGSATRPFPAAGHPS